MGWSHLLKQWKHQSPCVINMIKCEEFLTYDDAIYFSVKWHLNCKSKAVNNNGMALVSPWHVSIHFEKCLMVLPFLCVCLNAIIVIKKNTSQRFFWLKSSVPSQQDSLDARGFKAGGMFTTIEISRFDGLLDCFSNHTNPAIKIYSNTIR